MAASGSILSCFGRKKEQQEEPQTSNRLNKPFRCLKQFCCIGKIHTQSSDPSASANIELSAPANIAPSASANIKPSASADDPAHSADDPAHLIHPYGPEIVANRENSVIKLPYQRGFPRFTDPEIASLLSSQIWRVLGENVPNELGIIKSTHFNFRSSFLRLFYMAGLVPPERERGFHAALFDANRMTWFARLRNLPPRGIGVDYEDFAIHYGLLAQDYVYLMETANPHKMIEGAPACRKYMKRPGMSDLLWIPMPGPVETPKRLRSFVGRIASSFLSGSPARPLSSAHALGRKDDGSWEWATATGISPAPRYQHAAAFVNSRLHVSGGAYGRGHMEILKKFAMQFH